MKKFLPFVQISADTNTVAGDRIAIMFSSVSEEDLTPFSRVIFVPRSIVGLAGETDVLDGGAVRVKLLVTADGAGVQEHVLGVVTLPNVPADQISKAVVIAFRDAFAAYLQWVNAQAAGLTPVAAPRAWSDPALSSPKAPGRSVAKSIARVAGISVAGLGIAMLIGFGLTELGARGVGGGVGQGAAAVQAAVAQNMAQDPAAIKAQVELTQQTLRQMGIEPGRPGDLGCLAPQ